MKNVLSYLFISLIFISNNAFSQESESPAIAQFLIEAGLEYGGDEILQIFFTNGEDQRMLAGQGGYAAVGGQLEFKKVKNLLIRASIGIKYNTTAADNANIRLTRLPVNLIPYWKIKNDFRIGVGITTHQNVRFKGDGFVSDADFTSSIGPRVELGYKGVALTYSSVNYIAETDDVFSAGSFGLSFSYVFSKK